GKVAALLGVHALASDARLPAAAGRLGVLRQGDDLLSGRRPPQGLLPDRSSRRCTEDPREGDGEAALAGPGARGVSAPAALVARHPGRRRGVGAPGLATAAAAAAREPAVAAPAGEPAAAAHAPPRGPALDRQGDPSVPGPSHRGPPDGADTPARELPL